MTQKPDTTARNACKTPVQTENQPKKTMNCIKTNLEYRKAVQSACRKSFETACDREHFSARIDGICHLIREISDTPQTDVSFVTGVAWALLTLVRWSE